jgi:hypothetical protein
MKDLNIGGKYSFADFGFFHLPKMDKFELPFTLFYATLRIKGTNSYYQIIL